LIKLGNEDKILDIVLRKFCKLQILVVDKNNKPVKYVDVIISLEDAEYEGYGYGDELGLVEFIRIPEGKYKATIIIGVFARDSTSLRGKMTTDSFSVEPNKKNFQEVVFRSPVGTGIPGFPLESVISGLVLGVLVFWWMQRRK